MNTPLVSQTCHHCQFAQSIRHLFCVQCGQQLGSPCHSCGELGQSTDKFCGFCGEDRSISPPADPKRPNEERRQIVVLFSDICGYTRLSENRDPEEVQNIIKPLFERLTRAIEQYGGTIDKYIGDGMMAVFGWPIRHRDDPERALLSALKMQKETAHYAEELMAQGRPELQIRIGLHSGLVVTGTFGTDENLSHTVIGDTVNTAARMEQNAPPGGILISETLQALCPDKFKFETAERLSVKGKSQPIQTYLLQSLSPSHTRHLQTVQLIGRQSELKQLEATLQPNKMQWVWVEGAAGMGKTHLIRAYQQSRPHPHSYLEIQAHPYTQGFSYYLLQQWLQQMLFTLFVQENSGEPHWEPLLKQHLPQLTDLDRKTLETILTLDIETAELKSLTVEQFEQRLYKSVENFLLALQDYPPFIVHFRYFEWCDIPSLKCFQSLAAQADTPPPLSLYMLCSGRQPPKTEIAWQLHLYLPPLTLPEVTELTHSLLGLSNPQTHLQAVYQTLAKISQGNPFYLQEYIKTLIAQDYLIQEAGKWQLHSSIDTWPIPTSLHDLVLSQIDRLTTEERALLQVASAFGQRIDRPLLEGLYHTPKTWPVLLHQLMEKELLAEDPNLPDQLFFVQPLVQEVIYDTLLHQRKAELHQQIAVQIEERVDKHPSPEKIERLAYHYAKSRADLPAIKYLYLAALQSLHLYDHAETLSLLSTALHTLKNLETRTFIPLDLQHETWLQVPHMQLQIQSKQAEVHLLLGDYPQVKALCKQSLEQSQNSLTTAQFYFLYGQVYEKQSQFEKALSIYEQGLQALGEHIYCLERVQLLKSKAWVLLWLKDYPGATTVCEETLTLLENLPNIRYLAYIYNILGVIEFNKENWEQALAYYQNCLDLQEKNGDLWGQGNSLNNIGNVYTMQEHWQASETHYLESLKLRESFNDQAGIALSYNNLGHVYTRLKKWKQAEYYLLKSMDAHQKLNNPLVYAVAQSNLGVLYLHQQKYTKAIATLSQGIEKLETLNREGFVIEFALALVESYQAQKNEALENQWLTRSENLLNKYPSQKYAIQWHYLKATQALNQSQPEKAFNLLQTEVDHLQIVHDTPFKIKYLSQLCELGKNQNAPQLPQWQGLLDDIQRVSGE